MTARVKRAVDDAGGEHMSFVCPGCGDRHAVRVSGIGMPAWGFNGNVEKPTFTPSILVRTGHHVPGFEDGRGMLVCSYNAEHPEDATFECYVCHSFVTDGGIQFLSDCTHALAGQIVPLPDLPEGT